VDWQKVEPEPSYYPVVAEKIFGSIRKNIWHSNAGWLVNPINLNL